MPKFQKGNLNHHRAKKAALKWARVRAEKFNKTYWVITHYPNNIKYQHLSFSEIVEDNPTTLGSEFAIDIFVGVIEVERVDPPKPKSKTPGK